MELYFFCPKTVRKPSENSPKNVSFLSRKWAYFLLSFHCKQKQRSGAKWATVTTMSHSCRMNMFVQYNANPANNHVGDCVIRAVSKVTGKTWEEAYAGILLQGFVMFDMPSANRVWGAYLRHIGYVRQEIPNTCPDCYTVEDFCRDHPEGSYLLSLDGHVVAVDSGNYFDTWDSGSEPVIAYFFRKEDK